MNSPTENNPSLEVGIDGTLDKPDNLNMDAAPLRRKDVGLVGAILVGIQAFVSISGAHVVSEQVESFRKELVDIRLAQEQFFVRKTELGMLSEKLDHMSSEISNLKEQVSGMKVLLQQEVSFGECDPNVTYDEKVSFR
jgi:hypothetical protein